MHAKASIHIDAPVEMVDSLAVAADTWPQWVVGMGDPDRVEGDGGEGTRIGFPMEMGGKRFHLWFRVESTSTTPTAASTGTRGFRRLTGLGDVGFRAERRRAPDLFQEMEAEPFPGIVSKIFAFLFVERLLNRGAQQTSRT